MQLLYRTYLSQLDTGVGEVFWPGPTEDNIQKKWTFKLKASKLSEASLITYCKKIQLTNKKLKLIGFVCLLWISWHQTG